MLDAIKTALTEVSDTTAFSVPSKAEQMASREQAVINLLNEKGEISNSDVRELFSVSPATANRILNSMITKNLITRFRRGKSWAYKKL